MCKQMTNVSLNGKCYKTIGENIQLCANKL